MNIRTIARALNISSTTVSLSLRGHPRISKTTRDQVLQMAEQLGYQHCSKMRQLMTEIRRPAGQRSMLKIAMVNLWSHPLASGPEEPLRDFFAGSRTRAEALGYQWLEIPADCSNEGSSRLRKRLISETIDGVLIFASETPDVYPNLETCKIPVVNAGWIGGGGHMHIVADHHGNTERAVRFLLHSGCKRIGLSFLSRVQGATCGRVLGGYFSSSYEAGHKLVPPLLLPAPHKSPEVLAQYIQSNRLDGIVVSPLCDPVAIRSQLGRDYKNLLIVGNCGCYAEDMAKGLFGVDENWRKIGMIAMTQLDRLIMSRCDLEVESGDVIIVPGSWVNNSTSTKLPRKSSRTLPRQVG